MQLEYETEYKSPEKAQGCWANYIFSVLFLKQIKNTFISQSDITWKSSTMTRSTDYGHPMKA